VLVLLVGCVASDDEVFIDLVECQQVFLEETMHTTNLVTNLATELQELKSTLRQWFVSRAVLLVLDPVVLLASLAAVVGHSALGALETAILEARAGSATNGLRSSHLSLQD